MSPSVLDALGPLAGGLLRALAVNSLYAALVFAVVAVLLALAPGCGPRLRRTLWLLVLVRLVLPPDLTHPWSLGAAVARWGRAAAGAPRSVDVGLESVGPAFAAALPTSSDPAAARLPWQVGLSGLWLAGVAFALGRWRRALRPYHRIARLAVPAQDPTLVAVLERWRRRLGVRRRVRLRLTGEPVSPFTLGVLRPLVVLPRAAVERPAVLEPALAHELAHVARGDALWLGLEHLLHCLYFFHPLVRLTCSALDHERERSCDRRVLEAGGMTARDYATGLVEALGLGLAGAGAATFVPRTRRITMRIRSILEPRRRLDLPTPLVVLLVGLLGAVGLPMAGGSTATSEIAPVPADPAPAVAVAVAGQLANPLPDGRLTMPFGPGLNPFSHEEFHHDGVDLAAPLGTPVRAPADGVVLKTRVDFGDSPRGRLVMLGHDGELVTTFSHLDEVRVEPGQRVLAGDVIATVGSTGLSTGPHLHFEVRRIGEPTPLNPATVVDGL